MPVGSGVGFFLGRDRLARIRSAADRIELRRDGLIAAAGGEGLRVIGAEFEAPLVDRPPARRREWAAIGGRRLGAGLSEGGHRTAGRWAALLVQVGVEESRRLVEEDL